MLLDSMTLAAELIKRRVRKAALYEELLPVRRGAVDPAWHLDGLLYVQSEAGHSCINLQVSLWLPIAAHCAKDHRRPPVA